MLSVIIITYNEEKYLPNLLKSIKKQNFEDYEIIVSDNDSRDKTKKIAKNHGCRITKGGLPSFARNNGAKIANGDILLFLDSDTRMPPSFLRDNLNEFNKRNLEAATCKLIAYPKNIIDTIIIKSWNTLVSLSRPFCTHFYGCCIFTRKDFFNTLNGFDTNVKVGEDNDFARRASKKGKVGILRSKKIYFSTRRLKTEGRFRLIMKYALIELHRFLIGEIKSNKFKYFFDYQK